jgi:hypothetical protein
VSEAWFVIEYTDNSLVWNELRASRSSKLWVSPGKTITVYDYEAPPAHVRQYRAYTVYQMNTGDLLMSDPTPPLMAVLYLRNIWVKDVYNPQVNFTIPVETKWMPVTNNKKRRVVEPLGREKPVVVGGAANYDQWSYTYTVVGETNWALVQTAIAADRTYLVQTPRRQWYAQVSDSPSIEEDNFSVQDEPARRVTLAFTEVDPA